MAEITRDRSTINQMSYAWNTKNSLESKTESRKVQHYETYDAAKGYKAVERLVSLGYKAEMRRGLSDHAVTHYELWVTFEGDDWKRDGDWHEVQHLIKTR